MKSSEPIHKYQFQTLVDSSAARDRVRLLCLQNSYSGAWLNICPSAAAGLRLGNPEFNILCRFRLGCDILPQFARNCALCGAASDVFGDHLLCCQQNGIVRRHNAIVDQLARVTKAAGLPYTVDRAIDVDHRQRPGDLILPRWQGVSPLYIDVTITHPLALSNNWANIRSGREELLRSEEAKRCKYINILPLQDQLVVFGMTTFGQLSVGAENFLHDLAAIYTSAVFICRTDSRGGGGGPRTYRTTTSALLTTPNSTDAVNIHMLHTLEL